MAYQALLFCPDEKTARAITQVLSELDFETIACTEPFGAVKKLMAQHFDAVVVDCDNEQNATLLFKSARNAPNNLSALAVAVVEGQAGVAKAFRIGANLVLTKPINIEQAKGTLRVARGLLRKSEAAKGAPVAGGVPTKAADPIPPQPAPKPVTVRPASQGPVWPQSPTPPATVPVWKPAASAPASSAGLSAASQDGESVEASAPQPMPRLAAKADAPAHRNSANAIAEAKAAAVSVARPASPMPNWGGAASAAAPALEVKAAQVEAPSELAAPVVSPQEITPAAVIPRAAEADVASEPGAAETKKSKSSGSKKGLFIVLAIVLIAAAAYFAWVQGEPWKKPAVVPEVIPAAIPARPITPSAVLPHAESAVVPPASVIAAPSPVPAAAGSKVFTPSRAAAPTTTPVKVDVQPHPGKNADKDNSPAPTSSTKAKSDVLKLENSKSANESESAAPPITAITTGNSALPNLAGSAGQAPTPVLASKTQGFTQGAVIRQIQPQYPPKALQMGIEGNVQLVATVSKKGDVSAVKILSGNTSLAGAAADAVKQWKYKPFQLNGDPVEIQVPVTVRFKLPR
jgi:protein TonB